MSGRSRASDAAGLVGPVAVLGGACLLVVAPVLRGSDYFIALIPLEIIALLVLVALGTRISLAAPGALVARPIDPAVLLLVASPLVIGLVQLIPLPASWWTALPGHARYAQALADLGIPVGAWRAASISPDATRASLLAALPLVAAFLLGLLAGVHQLRRLLRIVAAVAFAEVALALLQLSGGERSPFYFGMMTYGSPIGSLGTRNEYANLLGMALAAYTWLAYDAVRYSMRFQPGAPLTQGRFDDRHALAAWISGGLLLVLGILISRSRAGATFGLACAMLALGAAGLRVFGWSRGWRFVIPVVIAVLLGAITMVGLDAVIGRVTGDQLQSSASFRQELWRGTFDAALSFFPLGSGWGTFDIAYRPFQTAGIVGYPNHAHQDYLEMFLEGGALFLLAAACAAWLLARRAAWLLAQAWRERTLDRESMMAALCGIGLLGFLMHACVDFPMRVPANAILASLLAGVFLRPLPVAKKPAGPRPAEHESSA